MKQLSARNKEQDHYNIIVNINIINFFFLDFSSPSWEVSVIVVLVHTEANRAGSQEEEKEGGVGTKTD